MAEAVSPSRAEVETLRQERDRIKANIHASYGNELERLLKEHQEAKIKASPAQEREKHLIAILDNRTPLRQQVRSVQEESLERLIRHTAEDAGKTSDAKSRLDMLMKMREEHEAASPPRSRDDVRISQATASPAKGSNPDATQPNKGTVPEAWPKKEEESSQRQQQQEPEGTIIERSIRFTIKGCTGLLQRADTDSVSPFAKVMDLNKKPVLSTQVVEGNQNPTWSPDAANVAMSVSSAGFRTMEIQIWHWGSVKNAFLGMVQISERDLFTQSSSPSGGATWDLPLLPREYEGDKDVADNVDKLGKIHLVVTPR